VRLIGPRAGRVGARFGGNRKKTRAPLPPVDDRHSIRLDPCQGQDGPRNNLAHSDKPRSDFSRKNAGGSLIDWKPPAGKLDRPKEAFFFGVTQRGGRGSLPTPRLCGLHF